MMTTGTCLTTRPFTGQKPVRAISRQQRRAPIGRRISGPVAAMGGGPFEELADKLGDEVYADLNGWRLYLRDMKGDGSKKMNQVLAESIGSGSQLEDALKKISISLGGGKKDISLFDVVPDNQIRNAKRAVEDLDL